MLPAASKFYRKLSARNLSAIVQPAPKHDDPELVNAKPFKDIPVQSYLFCRENLPFGPLFGAPPPIMHEYFRKKHNTDILLMKGELGKKPMVFIFTPEDIEKVFKFEGEHPERYGLDSWSYWRATRSDIFKKFIGLTLSQGAEWQKYRSIINPVMMKPATVALYIPVIDEVAKEFVHLTRQSCDSNNETRADYVNLIQRFAMEAIGTVALETRLNVLGGQGGDANELFHLLTKMFVLTYKLDHLPSLWKVLKPYRTPTLNELCKTWDRAIEIIQKYVQAAADKLEKEGSQQPEALQSVFYKLSKIDKEVAFVMALDMFAAGIDTTTASIIGLFYYLAANPQKQNILREELVKALPDKYAPLTPAHFASQTPYLRACIMEFMRIQPVVQGNIRRIPQDLCLAGYRVPAGMDVAFPTPLLTVDEKLYPKPLEFIPERWIKDKAIAAGVDCPHCSSMHPYSYVPFGFGKRACIGKRFAELEMKIIVTRMIREFKMSWHYPKPAVRHHTLTTLTGEMKFRLEAVDV